LNILRRKDLSKAVEDSQAKGKKLARQLGIVNLTALGIGAIIGSGIFVLTGVVAANYTGPGIVISFLISGIGAGLAALVYAEMASAIPVSGSAYSYSYVTLGEIVAWIIGWNLVLEYAVAAGAVAVGWSAYFASLVQVLGLQIPKWLSSSPLEGGLINLPATLITLAITSLLIRGIKGSTLLNSVVVVIKLAVILLFILVGVSLVKPVNWSPFLPYGFMGTVQGAALIFFAYIGFDAVSTAAEEVKKPRRDLPIGIILSLLVSTVLYIAVGLILTGIVPYRQLNTAAPVAKALMSGGLRWGSLVVSVGALAGLTSVLLATTFAQSRIFFAMARDGLIPGSLARLHPRFQTPYLITAAVGLFVALIASFLPVRTLAQMANIGTLSAFFATSVGVLALERRVPPESLPFRVPFSPYLPVASALFSLYLALNLPPVTWIRFGVWIVIGLVIYFFYGYRNSTVNKDPGRLQPAALQPAFKKRRE